MDAPRAARRPPAGTAWIRSVLAERRAGARLGERDVRLVGLQRQALEHAAVGVVDVAPEPAEAGTQGVAATGGGRRASARRGMRVARSTGAHAHEVELVLSAAVGRVDERR